MARNKNTGEKTTSPKAWRQHAKAVDTAIRQQTDDTPAPPATQRRMDETFAHLHRTAERYCGRH